MKYLIFLGVLIGLYVFGHILGPHLTPLLVSEVKPSTKLQRTVQLPGGFKMDINLAELRDAELPQTVKMKRAVEIPLVAGGGTKVLGAGDEVTLKNRNGDHLIIESFDQLAKGEVPIAATDIFEDIAKQKFEAFTASSDGKEEMKKDKPEEPQKKEEPEKMAQKETAKTPEPSKTETKEPVEQPTEEPKMADKKTEEMQKPADEPAPTPAAGKLSEEQIVEAMKADVKKGHLKEFTFDQVKGWKAAGEEEIDGVLYQIGLVIYGAETIFGFKSITAKALFKDGKLEKWVFANTGMQIR